MKAPDRRRCLNAAVIALFSPVLPAARAQADWRVVAVPYVGVPQFMRGVWAHHSLPLARTFRAAARALRAALAASTPDRAAARTAWREALQAWAALGAVPVGPLIQRRSSRRIDFLPARPAQVLRAIERLQAQPDLRPDEFGGPAKGFGAIEWLLWDARAPVSAAATRYAVFVAEEIDAEAEALVTGFAALASDGAADDDSAAAFVELMNQWVGALQGLQIALQRSATQQADRAPRARSRAALAEQAARWGAMDALTRVAIDTPRPVPGTALVPLEMLLRGRGLNPLADRLAASAHRAADVLGATPREAARAVAALQQIAEREVAPAFDVRIGFSDADGD